MRSAYWSELQSEFKDCWRYLFTFLRNPVQKIRELPEWSWPLLIALHIMLSLFSGALYGLVELNPISMITGMILLPITSIITNLVTTAFLYYTILIFRNVLLPPKRLFTLIFLANIPFYIFHTIASFVPPIDLVGFAFAGILIIVGLVDNFNLPKKFAIRVILTIYILFFAMWILSRLKALT